MSIYDLIANPRMADISGALDIRQQRIDKDAALRREIRMGQLLAEATPNLEEGSTLHELAVNAPKEYAVLTKALGIPLNAGEEMQQYANDVSMLYHLAQGDPAAALERAHALKEQRNENGIETPQIDKWLAQMADDPQTGLTSLFTIHRSINRDGADKPAGQREFESLVEAAGYEPGSEEAQRAARIRLRTESPASTGGMKTFRMKGADGRERVFRFDPKKGGLEVFDGNNWNPAGKEDRKLFQESEGGGATAGGGQPSGDKPGLFVGRSAEEESRAVVEGTPPKGFKFNDSGRIVPIQGSPEARKLENQRKAAKGILDRKVPGVLRDITRAIEEADNAGPVAGAFALPGENAGRMTRASAALSPAYELNQHLESIKSNISIDELQSMREASPTGGALGQVPVRQQEFLMQVQGSLLPTIPPEVLKENLATVSNNYLKVYLDAIYGDEQEWQTAIDDGQATTEDARLSLQEKEDMFEKYKRDTDFDDFGGRKGSGKNKPSQKREGAILMEDANGNRAYVYPNGDLEEIR